jgi:hypothetical protein
MVLAASLGLAGCAFIDELKDTVSKIISQDEHEGRMPDATVDGGILSMRPPREVVKKASTEKDPPARKLQERHTVKLPNKSPTSVPTEPVRPQGSAPQSAPSQSGPLRLPTSWPEAPPPGSFSR